MRCRLVLLLILLAASPIRAADIYLVRHAEKAADGSKDPALTAAGKQRAADLAELLRSAGIQHVYSTDYVRTRETARPLAESRRLEIEIYDPEALGELSRRLLALERNALVVGHSNTTPELVEQMGGEGGPPIAEAWEYDRVYLVQTENGRVRRTILFHLPPAGVPGDF